MSMTYRRVARNLCRNSGDNAMKKALLRALILVGTSVGFAFGQNWPLVWADSFKYTGTIDTAKWHYDTGRGPNNDGWGNGELEYYTNSEANAIVNNGLEIIAIPKDTAGGYFTSARLTTKNKMAFKYGRIDARIKFPKGKGVWPCLWMLGNSYPDTVWPHCGEVDIAEMMDATGGSADNVVDAAAHWWENTTNAEGDYALSYPDSASLSAKYHVYSLTWDSLNLTAFIDSTTQIWKMAIPASNSSMAAFHNQFFILLNLAIGGNPLHISDSSLVTASMPETLFVDYVRVYSDSVDTVFPVPVGVLPGNVNHGIDASHLRILSTENHLTASFNLPYKINQVSISMYNLSGRRILMHNYCFTGGGNRYVNLPFASDHISQGACIFELKINEASERKIITIQ